MSKFRFFMIDHSHGFLTIFGQISWNSNDWIIRNWQVSAKAISLNFSSNCTCAALNWVPWSVARGFLRFISFENKQCVNQLIPLKLFVLLFKSQAGFYTTLLSVRKLCSATLSVKFSTKDLFDIHCQLKWECGNYYYSNLKKNPVTQKQWGLSN